MKRARSLSHLKAKAQKPKRVRSKTRRPKMQKLSRTFSLRWCHTLTFPMQNTCSKILGLTQMPKQMSATLIHSFKPLRLAKTSSETWNRVMVL
jgi:hypothetical protein